MQLLQSLVRRVPQNDGQQVVEDRLHPGQVPVKLGDGDAERRVENDHLERDVVDVDVAGVHQRPDAVLCALPDELLGIAPVEDIEPS